MIDEADELASLAAEFAVFREACIDLRILANTHDGLFGSCDMTSTLERVAIHCFNDIHRWMIEAFIVKASRLLDPATQGRFKNLSVKHLHGSLAHLNKTTARVDELVAALSGYGKLLSDARSKAVAHQDLETAMNPGALGQHTLKEYSDFLEHLQEFCDEVGRIVGKGPLDLRSVPGEGDHIDLIEFLEFGLRAKDHFQEREGKSTPVRGLCRN